jgi:site-specific DNA-cytosine methylase
MEEPKKPLEDTDNTLYDQSQFSDVIRTYEGISMPLTTWHSASTTTPIVVSRPEGEPTNSTLAFDTQFGSNANVFENISPTLKASQQPPSFITTADENEVAYTEALPEPTPTGNLCPWPEMGEANMVYRVDTPTRTVKGERHLILADEETTVYTMTGFASYTGKGVVGTLSATHRQEDHIAISLPIAANSDQSQSEESQRIVGAVYDAASIVRRLTPVECERLQGFPDGWTEDQADGHRYKQMGNAVAVPCVEWIIKGVLEVDGR